MVIESLKIENFRNYQELRLRFDPGTNIFFGNNAQGKTNILESIYLCGTTKSHKGSKDKEMIRFGTDEAHISMELRRHEVLYKLDMHLRKNKAKGIAINGVPIRRAGELLGIGNFVFFSPEDLNIIKNGPAERRRFLDLELCQLSRVYLHNLSNYNKVLNQRNKILKDSAWHPEYLDTLDIWDLQLVQYGKKVIEERDAFVKRLNGIITDIHRKLTGGAEEICISYENNTDASELEEKLAQGRERDFKMKTTQTGPHRDDLCFQVNGIDIRKYGSQGQQRTAALSLKLAEIQLVREEIKDSPVLLLDDVLSELDRNRQHYLLESIEDIQTLITCTGIDDFVENQFELNRVFQVINGTVEEGKRGPC